MLKRNIYLDNAIRLYRSIDIFLIVFLLFFTMDMVVIKPIVLIAALIWLKGKISIKNLNGYPLFYLFIPLIEVFRFCFFNGDFSKGHAVSFSLGISYWLMSLIAFLIVKNRVDKCDSDKTDNSLRIFFYINLACTLLNLLIAVLRSHSLNPYGSEAMAFGNSTGDYMKGVFLGPSYINMFVNSFYAFYFLHKKRYWLVPLAAFAACLTGSNFANLFFIPMLILAFFIIKDRKSKIVITVSLLVFAMFYIVISKGNRNYIIDSILNDKKKDRMENVSRLSRHAGHKGLPPGNVSGSFKYGKVLSFKETLDYLGTSLPHFLFGAGIGNFSSQLAVRTSDISTIKKSRLFRMMPVYVSTDFYNNHYQIFHTLYSMPPEYHSVKHQPNSFLNQLFGEYGFIGFLLFLLFYVFFFLRDYKKLSYSLYIMALLGGYLLFDYLFEYLSVVLFFELFFLLDKKSNSLNKALV